MSAGATESKPATGPHPPSHRRAVWTLLAGVVGIGFAPLLVKLADTGPSMTAAWRVLLAWPFLWAWWVAEQRGTAPSRRPAGRRDFLGLAAAGVLFVADLGLWHASLRMTSAANSTVLSNLAPVFVGVMAWRFLGERLTRGYVAGLVIALAGAALLVGRSFDLDSGHARGDLLALATAVFYAGYLLSVKILRRRFSAVTIMAWSGLVSGPGFVLVAWLSGETLIPGGAQGWFILVTLALVCHVGGQCLIGYGLGHLPASFSSLSLLVQPVMAAVLAWVLLGESLGAGQIAGGLLVLAGIALAGGLVRFPVLRPRPG